jgi:DNA-binding protein HU-beta
VTKAELITEIALSQNLKGSDVEKVLDELPRAIGAALREGKEIQWRGFGTFSRQDRAASEGRNPRTGEKIAIAARKVVRFRAGKGLTEAVQS